MVELTTLTKEYSKELKQVQYIDQIVDEVILSEIDSMLEDPFSFTCIIEYNSEEKVISFTGLKLKKNSILLLKDKKLKYLENEDYLEEKSSKVIKCIEEKAKKLARPTTHRIFVDDKSIPANAYEEIRKIIKKITKDFKPSQNGFNVVCNKNEFEKIEKRVSKLKAQITSKICWYDQEDMDIGRNIKYRCDNNYLSIAEYIANESKEIILACNKDGSFKLIGSDDDISEIENRIP